MIARYTALLSGPLLFFLILVLPAPAGMSYPAQMTAAAAAWMAVWWITEPVNPAVTALLTLIIFPLGGLMPMKTAAAEFGNEIVFLFLAGFLFGATIERWHLHKRIALRLAGALGQSAPAILLGFMTATAFVSMWISNTATAVMMTPVAIAVVERYKSGNTTFSAAQNNFAKALLLGVGYAASIGGLATTVGTPTNAVFLAFIQQKMGMTVTFAQWLLFGFPLAVTLLAVCWLLLLWLFPIKNIQTASEVNSKEAVKTELSTLGKLTRPEARLLLVFGAVILAWVSGSLFWYKLVPNCNDTLVALCGAVSLFFIPASPSPGSSEHATASTLLDWSTAVRIPWGILLFFGGGLALAKAFDQSGLAAWMGSKMTELNQLHPALILFSILVLVVLLSELASNIATASMMMPVLAALATTMRLAPVELLLAATLAASFGFGLPVATAPNTVVYSSGYFRSRDMARAGFILDFIAILLLMFFFYTLLPWIFH